MSSLDRRRSLTGLLILAMTLISTELSHADAQEAEELKAAFVYRLCHFVTWPERDNSEPFVIGVLDAPKIEDELARLLAGRRIGDREVEIRRFERLSAMDKADLVFVPESYRRWTERIVRFYDGQPTLTVGAFEDFAVRGGVVSLYVSGESLELALNHNTASRSKLALSPRLLAVAKTVISKP